MKPADFGLCFAAVSVFFLLSPVVEALSSPFNDSSNCFNRSFCSLVKFKGVGRKTANLVLSRGFNKPAICVDVHVHRIFNRLGYVKTKNPEETEFALREKLPKKYWIDINTLIVTFGQNICKPQKPLCEKCPISKYCDKIFD